MDETKATALYVSRPSMPPLEDFIPYLNDIWKTKSLTNGGVYHQQFEQALCRYLGVKYISLFTNGTLALITALQALQIKGEVITTPYTFVATAHSLLWSGITPVFVDIDADSLNLDPAKIEAAITAKTTAILPVHCYGRPCNVEGIQAIADRYDLKVIYDAAHAFGSTYGDQSLLNFGDLSVLSFHATKVFHTFEGGAIVSHDEGMKKRIDNLKNFGFVDEVTVTALGLNGKMSEVNAAFGVLQLKKIDQELRRRRELDCHYRNLLRYIDGIQCASEINHKQLNYAYFPILVKNSYRMSRDELYQELKDNNIYARRYFYPLVTEFPMYSHLLTANAANLPIATAMAQEVICLPIHPEIEYENIEYIAKLIKG